MIPYDLLDFSAEIPDFGFVERAVCGILQNKQPISGTQPSDKDLSLWLWSAKSQLGMYTPSCAPRPRPAGPFELVCALANICSSGPGKSWEIRGQQAIEGKGPAAPEEKSLLSLHPGCYNQCLFLRCSVCGGSSGINTVHKYYTEVRYSEGCFGK